MIRNVSFLIQTLTLFFLPPFSPLEGTWKLSPSILPPIRLPPPASLTRACLPFKLTLGLRSYARTDLISKGLFSLERFGPGRFPP